MATVAAGVLLDRVEKFVAALASQAEGARDGASAVELARLQKVCTEVQAQYARSVRPVVAIAGLAAVGGADDDCEAGLRILNAWLCGGSATPPPQDAAGGSVHVACVRSTHPDDAVQPMDAAAWTALFNDDDADNDTTTPAVHTNGVFPVIAGVQIRTVVHIRHADQHQIALRFRNVRAVKHAAGGRLPGRLRAALPAGGYAVEHWTFSSDGPAALSGPAIRAAMAAWLHAHVFGPDALWGVIEAVRVELPSAVLESGTQLMVLPSGPATVTEQLFSVPAMDAVSAVLLCAGQHGPGRSVDLSGAACHLTGVEAAFPVAVLASGASPNAPGLHLHMAPSNPFLASTLDGTGPRIDSATLASGEAVSSTSTATALFDVVRRRGVVAALVALRGRVLNPLLRVAYHVRTLVSLQSTLGTWDAAEVYASTSAARMIQASATNPQAPFSQVIVGSTVTLYRYKMRPVFASLLAAAVKSTIAAADAAVRTGPPPTVVPAILRVLAAIHDFLVPPLSTLDHWTDLPVGPRGAVPSGDSSRKRKATSSPLQPEPEDHDGDHDRSTEKDSRAYGGMVSMVVTAVAKFLYRDRSDSAQASPLTLEMRRLVSQLRRDVYSLVLERVHAQSMETMRRVKMVLPMMVARLLCAQPPSSSAVIQDVHERATRAISSAGAAACACVMQELDGMVERLVVDTLLPATGDALQQFYLERLTTHDRVMDSAFQAWCARVLNLRSTVAPERQTLMHLVGILSQPQKQ